MQVLKANFVFSFWCRMVVKCSSYDSLLQGCVSEVTHQVSNLWKKLICFDAGEQAWWTHKRHLKWFVRSLCCRTPVELPINSQKSNRSVWINAKYNIMLIMPIQASLWHTPNVYRFVMWKWNIIMSLRHDVIAFFFEAVHQVHRYVISYAWAVFCYFAA